MPKGLNPPSVVVQLFYFDLCLKMAAILDFRWSKKIGCHVRIRVDFHVCTIWMHINRFKVIGLCYKF